MRDNVYLISLKDKNTMNLLNSTKEIKSIPELNDYQGLVDAFNKNSLVVFLGAGVSRLVGCKSWDDLASSLLNKCYDLQLLNYHELNVINGYNDQKKKISIAYSLLRENNESEFYTEFFDSLKMNLKDGKKNIYKLLSVFSDTFVTTNADECFDSKFMTDDVVYDFSDVNKVEHNKLYHIHGSIRDKNSLVFTVEQYLNRYNGRNEDNCSKQFLIFLFDLFTNYSVLFIGYGLAEFELLDYLTLKSKNIKTEHQHYALMPYYSYEQKIADYDQLYYSNLNINIIPYAKDKNGYEQLIYVLDDWSNKFSFLNRIDAELEDVFSKNELSDYDSKRIVEIILRDEGLLKDFLKLCKNTPKHTIKLIEKLYENDFFNPNKNCDFWQILGFLEIYVAFCKKNNSKTGSETFQKIIDDNIKITKERIKSYRTDAVLLEIIFSLNESEIKPEYIDFLEYVFENENELLLSAGILAQQILPVALNYKNIDFIKRIVTVLFSITINDNNFPYIFSKVDLSFLRMAVDKYIEKIQSTLEEDFIYILINIVKQVPSDKKNYFTIRNYKSGKPVFDDYYINFVFNILIWAIKKTPNSEDVLENLKSNELVENLRNVLLQNEEIPQDESYSYAMYDKSTNAEEDINNFSADDILLKIKNASNEIEKSKIHVLIEDWIEKKYNEIDKNEFDKFLGVEPYFKSSIISAFCTLIRNDNIEFLQNIDTLLSFYSELLSDLFESRKNENNYEKYSSYCLKNICSFIYRYIQKFMKTIDGSSFDKMKKIILKIYEKLSDKEIKDSSAYLYNSDLLNSESGICYESLFYLYAYTKEIKHENDDDILNIFNKEISSEEASSFFTMLGKNLEYFFYHEKNWIIEKLYGFFNKENTLAQKSFWSGYFYSSYRISKECYLFLRNNDFYKKLIELNLQDSEYYKKISDITCVMYLGEIEKTDDENSLIKYFLEKHDIKFLKKFINSFLIRKNYLGVKYENLIVKIWEKIEESINEFKENKDCEEIVIDLLKFISFINEINDKVYLLLKFSIRKIPYYQIDYYMVSKLLELYENDVNDNRKNVEQVIIDFGNSGTFFYDYNNSFSNLFNLICENNKEKALEIATVYMKSGEEKYLKLYRKSAS